MDTQHRKASPEIRRRLSVNLKRLRKARGYTQEELANFCQFDRNYISNVEQGRLNVTLASLETLARGLGCSEEDLLRPNPRRGG